MAKAESGLTLKQEAFVQKLVECRNQREAYRHAYSVDEGTSANTVDWEAWELMKNPKVTQRLSDLQAAAAKAVFYNVSDAFGELEEARSSAMKLEQNAAAVTAVKSKMELFGLGSKNFKIDANVTSDVLTPEQQSERVATLIPQIAPILIGLGWTPPEGGDDE